MLYHLQKCRCNYHPWTFTTVDETIKLTKDFWRLPNEPKHSFTKPNIFQGTNLVRSYKHLRQNRGLVYDLVYGYAER